MYFLSPHLANIPSHAIMFTGKAVAHFFLAFFSPSAYLAKTSKVNLTGLCIEIC